MRKILHILAVTACMTLPAYQGAQAHIFGNDHHVENAKKAKITFIEALQKAAELQSGIIISIELEDEDKLFYEVEIVNGEEVHEIHVDAITGKATFEERW